MNCNNCGCPIERDMLVCPQCNAEVNQILLSDAIERLKQGEEEAFLEIYEFTHHYVYQRAKYIIKDEQEAMDLMQEVYLALYKDLQKLNSNESIYGWLKTVTFRLGLRILEKKRKLIELPQEDNLIFEQILDEEESIESDYLQQQDMNCIKECILRLSEEHRMILCAYYYDNLKVEEIATQFQVSVGTVKSRLHYARKKLKLLLSEQEEKQGYKFYGVGGPWLATAIASIMDELTTMDISQKEQLEVSLKNAFFSDSVQELTVDSVSPAVELGELVRDSGETLVKGIGAAILAKLAEFGAKKVAVSMVSVGLATATAVTGYHAVQEEHVRYDQVESQVQHITAVEDPTPRPVQNQKETMPEPEEEPEPETVIEEEEFFYDEETVQEEKKDELENPRAVEDESYVQEARHGTVAFVPFGAVSEPQSFTLSKELSTTVMLLGTMVADNGIEYPIEGRYTLEIQNESGDVVASSSGEMNGEDVLLTKTLPKGSYDVILYNRATEMDLFDVLPYEMWIYY